MFHFRFFFVAMKFLLTRFNRCDTRVCFIFAIIRCIYWPEVVIKYGYDFITLLYIGHAVKHRSYALTAQPLIHKTVVLCLSVGVYKEWLITAHHLHIQHFFIIKNL